MPKLKKPSPLQNIAIDLLLERVLSHFDQFGDDCPPEKFREGLSVIKGDVFSLLPWYLVADVSKKFLDNFTSKVRPKWQYTAALEIVMDVEIHGLRCDGPILKHLDPEQGHRFRKLVVLDLSSFRGEIRLRLKKFHLNDLTQFVYPDNCTNSELRAIGRNCPKLRVLKLYAAYGVSNRGIRYLDPLRELRVIDIIGTKGVNYKGVNRLLSSHDKLEDFSYGQNQRRSTIVNGKDFLSKLDVSVQCPSIRRFAIASALVTNANLRSIIAKFPNLTHLAMTQSSVDDLSELRYLSKLESIELSLEPRYVESTWLQLKRLLSFIGANITSLKFICICRGVFLNQEGFDTLFEYCPNMKSLKLNHGFSNLIIPPFSKLTDLSLRVRKRPTEGEIVDQLLEFPEMPNLENLELYNFGLDLESVKSIVLDSRRFPVLKFLAISSLTVEETEDIQRVTRDKNLDIRIVNVTAVGCLYAGSFSTMPELKQPPSLRNIAMNLLLQHVLRYCEQLCAKDSLRALNEGISIIKKDMYSLIPWHFWAEFFEKFLAKFSSKKRPRWQYTTALELIMDVEIEGLQCHGPILKYLDAEQGHRFRKLIELDLRHFGINQPFDLRRFHLNDLTVLVCFRDVSTAELRVIGQNCSKLKCLRICFGVHVTNRALHLLDPCRELRVLNILGAGAGVYHIGVNHMLSVHNKLEEFSYVNEFRSQLDISVPCPSIKRITIESGRVGKVNLSTVVKKFPNLTHVEINLSSVDDLSELKFLTALISIKLTLNTITAPNAERSWLQLKELLSIFAENITTLCFVCFGQDFFVNQAGLNSIFEFCPNMKFLELLHGYDDLVIPPFANLEQLSLHGWLSPRDSIMDQVFVFPEMLNLQYLSLGSFGLELETVKSIMLDYEKFPKLKFLQIHSLTPKEMKVIQQIAKKKNLDFKVYNSRAYNRQPRPVRTYIRLIKRRLIFPEQALQVFEFIMELGISASYF